MIAGSADNDGAHLMRISLPNSCGANPVQPRRDTGQQEVSILGTSSHASPTLRSCGTNHFSAGLCLAICSVLLLIGMTGCAGATSPTAVTSAAYATSTPAATSATFGGLFNHLHDVLPLRGVVGTVLMATHLGLYRTTDRGRTWREVAGGHGQAMDGLMIFELAQSPLDPWRWGADFESDLCPSPSAGKS
jgi:hypothetical protein